MRLITPAFSSARNGRLTELCSKSVVITWSPGWITPLMARFSPSVQFIVRIQALGSLAAEELIQAMPALVEHSLDSRSHAVTRTPWIGQAGPGESIQRLIHRLWLGETRGGVVEVECMVWSRGPLRGIHSLRLEGLQITDRRS